MIRQVLFRTIKSTECNGMDESNFILNYSGCDLISLLVFKLHAGKYISLSCNGKSNAGTSQVLKEITECCSGSRVLVLQFPMNLSLYVFQLQS